jgi:hypothetical protein
MGCTRVGGLLDGARHFFRGFSPAPALRQQRFSVGCPEGHRLTGLRTEGYQALRCPTCGEGVFVLPRSPLPEPPGAPAARSAGRSAVASEVVEEEPVALTDPVTEPAGWEGGADAGAEDGDEIEWVDETEAVPPMPAAPADHKPWPDPGEFAAEEIEAGRTRGQATRPSEAGPGKSASARPKRAAVALEVSERPQAAPAPGIAFGDWLRSHRNGLVFLAVVTVVVATVAYRVHRARMADLPRVAEKGWTDGLPALDEGRFDTARQLLSEARDAVDSLGDESERASDIRQGAKEIAVLTSLSPDPLESLLEQAASSDTRDWTDRFNRIYKGRSFIVDARVTAVRDVSGGGRYDLDYRIFRPGEGDKPLSVGRLDLKGFALIETLKPRVGDRLLFGARLASFTVDPNSDEWLIGLEADSGVTLVHHKALEAIGWPVPDDSQEDERR